jgi:molybdopterin-containing oxidoreductase family membrane subunit
MWSLLVAVSVLAMAFAVYCFARQTELGFVVTGLRNPGYGGAAWGLYIACDVFFTGVSFAGITVAALARLFDVAALRPVTRAAELLTISALLAGACSIVADLGRPFDGLTKLPRVADPQSPFYGTFTLVVAGYLFSSLVFFFLSGRRDAARLAADPTRHRLRTFYRLWASGYRDTTAEHVRHRRVTFWLSIGILPLLVTAHSTLGFIFGIQSGRPGWYSALQAPAFVVLAAVSGTGLLILLALVARRLFAAPIPDESIRWLGQFLWILSLVYLYFIVVDELTANYAGPEADRAVAHAVVGGAFKISFWIVVGCLLVTVAIGFSQYVLKRKGVALLGAAAATANVAAVLKRLLIVVPSQTNGALLPMGEGTYAPTWIEVGIACGLVGLVAFVVLVFPRVFPLVSSSEPWPPRDVADLRDPARTMATVATITCAIALVVVGLVDSFRQIRLGEVDPRIPYSPVMFASGVMLLFGAAVVHELFPPKEASS